MYVRLSACQPTGNKESQSTTFFFRKSFRGPSSMNGCRCADQTPGFWRTARPPGSASAWLQVSARPHGAAAGETAQSQQAGSRARRRTRPASPSVSAEVESPQLRCWMQSRRVKSVLHNLSHRVVGGLRWHPSLFPCCSIHRQKFSAAATFLEKNN